MLKGVVDDQSASSGRLRCNPKELIPPTAVSGNFRTHAGTTSPAPPGIPPRTKEKEARRPKNRSSGRVSKIHRLPSTGFSLLLEFALLNPREAASTMPAPTRAD